MDTSLLIFVARLKKPVFSRHGRIFSRRDHISPVDEIWPDNNSSGIDVTEYRVGQNTNLRRLIVNARYKP